MTPTSTISRDRAIVLNRLTTSTVVVLALAGYFWQPGTAALHAFDIVLRAYLQFIAGSMAHESVHGHLGRTKSANLWWGRIALLPVNSAFVTFRKTHLQHHSATNIPEQDPDCFLRTRRSWQIPFRALLLPSYWVIWLWKHGRLRREDMAEYVLTCAAQAGLFAAIGHFAGMGRVLSGLVASATLHALVLWYAFAIKTHEGYSTGAAETRSHNYYGALLYRLTFGLSMHRLHHMRPELAWTQMAGQVPAGTWLQRLRFQRNILVQD